MSARKPEPSPHSEEELLEQWDFLDAMVERQATALRAGVQDVEEDHETIVAAPDLEQLGRRLEEVRTQLASSEKLRAEASMELDHLRRDSAAQRLEHQGLAAVHAQALEDLEVVRHRLRTQVAVNDDLKVMASAQREAAQRELGERTKHMQRELDSVRRAQAAELTALQQRLQQAEASASRWLSAHTAMLDALRTAHQEVEALQAGRAADRLRRHFWSRRR